MVIVIQYLDALIAGKRHDFCEVRDYVFLQRKDDGYDGFRRIYNDIMEQKIHEGRQGP